MLRRSRRLVAVGVALIMSAGCQSVSDGGGRLLPPALPRGPDFSEYGPDHPYESPKDGVAERSVFTASSGEGYNVEVRDFLVSPAQPKAHVVLAGAALLEVREGYGKATAGERKLDLRPGTVFTVGQEEQLYITEHREPLALRTWIIKPRGQS